MLCDRCEILPGELPEHCDLYISAPIEPSHARLRELLRSYGDVTEPYERVLCAELSASSLEHLCAEGFPTLGGRVAEDTRTLMTAPGVTPSVSNLVHMEPLSALIARVRGQGVVRLLRERRLLTYYQPIFEVGKPNKVYAHECLLRGVTGDGSIIPPGDLIQVAREAGLLFYLDREARLSAIRGAAQHRLPDTQKVFVNFNPTAIYAPEHCLKTTICAVEEANIDRNQLVFEIVECDHVADVDHLVRILDYYREQGFKVALDDLGAGYNSLTSLSRLRPDYMKLDMELTRSVDKDPYRAAIAENLLSLAHRLGITAVAEGIETEEELAWLADHGADLVQGYLFARPAPEPY